MSEQRVEIPQAIADLVQSHGGFESFLDWCEATTIDAKSTFDITDDVWAELHRRAAQ